MTTQNKLLHEKSELITAVIQLSNTLDVKYNNELNFRNHCYLRIAYDCAVNNKWDIVIKKPFIKHATITTLKTVHHLLNSYILDKNKLLSDNATSLHYRKTSSTRPPNPINTLFL